MFMSRASLKHSAAGGSGALAAFLSQSAERIGQSHHLVWSLFGDRAGARPFLYRLHGAGPAQPITIVSAERPTDAHNLWELETKPFTLLSNLRDGDELLWTIRVNATRKHGDKRRCIVMEERRKGDPRSYLGIAQAVAPAWLQAKLLAAGLEAAADRMAITAYDRKRFNRSLTERDQVTVAMTDVSGRGVVRSADALRAAMRSGIGAARAYGCGLLLIRRPR